MKRPITAGFLTGKLVYNKHGGTRFEGDDPLRYFAQKRLGAEVLCFAINCLNVGVKSNDLTSGCDSRIGIPFIPQGKRWDPY